MLYSPVFHESTECNRREEEGRLPVSPYFRFADAIERMRHTVPGAPARRALQRKDEFGLKKAHNIGMTCGYSVFGCSRFPFFRHSRLAAVAGALKKG